MRDELQTMKNRKVWELQELADKSKVLGCRWVVSIKRDDKNKIKCFKARLFFPRFRTKESECSQGHWDCHEASAADLILTPPPNIAPECNSAAHQVPTDCVSDCPLTCANYHHHQPCTIAVCSPGCK
ncbi:hypothetical protein AVEN_224360-1 [Araneus ventricosus]|uniref:Reverse transcriptase Ty1/copia-type domain-containing protein n=1 Tax=Araneus ventricosus TaxID=182803 RepID=A0A4Y2UIA5_ARAVE|nr:hypothetical protein AVEN_95862-1 [Araneus ventricosus]GBO10185.1 hypothetical protein AVEN_35775-1 [Araneus ventricosus]GBO11340.1 hypothetical protein AVEN_8748-1 [Araneus ventricosus]GBO11402.1 hypothetical protein AVEN_224360-1 [Araneus ventricosus]